MHPLVVRVLSEARRMGGLPADLDADLEAQRLAALLDGLTLRAALLPDGMPPARQRQVFRRHLDALASGG
ncbi:hypothetical protein GCM10010211_27340 [Streptomyces albospinus]|uniref:BetI-type transcriptional repressor C-terminal domain-containing protein n=2 Tax=Streptomyces albospinus TaxID=285515 RepID=A0ABQ2V100_9ACTN|nr:hypothetical protein GCM10010211_27340 [Streptomyces albospinus]